jgi:hypothetical protein
MTILIIWLDTQPDSNIPVFLGLANFYQRFIKNFKKMTKPMSNMRKGGKNGKFLGPFQATSKIKHAICRLPQASTTAPVLVHCNQNKPIQLDSESSSSAIVGILSQPVDQSFLHASKTAPTPGGKAVQVWHPDAFWSCMMVPAV